MDAPRIPQCREASRRCTRVLNAGGFSKTKNQSRLPAQHTLQRCLLGVWACEPESLESQAVFRCTHCSEPAEQADVNAARNILAAKLAVTAGQDAAQPSRCVVSPKQQPAGNREGLLLQPI